MILPFSEKFPSGKETFFETKIKEGKKIHTIRKDLLNRWVIGKKIHAYYNARTKKMRMISPVKECKSTQRIKIINDVHRNVNHIYIRIDGRNLNFDEIEMLVKNDGFDSLDDFFNWFSEDFEGKIIHWTDFKY